MKKKTVIPKSNDKKTKELMEYLKKGGREGAKNDFRKLVIESTIHAPFDKKNKKN